MTKASRCSCSVYIVPQP